MRLTDTVNKIKVSVADLPDIGKELFIIAFILLATIGSFMLGRLSSLAEKQKNELKILRTEPVAPGQKSNLPDVHGGGQALQGEVLGASQAGTYVGSRSGSTYYLPWCAGVKRIHEENKIWFKDKSDAISKGYKPSSTCKRI